MPKEKAARSLVLPKAEASVLLKINGRRKTRYARTVLTLFRLFFFAPRLRETAKIDFFLYDWINYVNLLITG